jgi:signal peptidase
VSAVAVPEPAVAGGSRAHLDRVLTALIVALAIALAAGLALRGLGLTALVDYTDSMRPAIAAGDVILDEQVPAGKLRRGDIASIDDHGRLITHRVVSVTPAGDRVTVVTRGDANDASERWVLSAGEPAKRMVGRVPWIGHVVVWLASPLLRALVLLAGALAFLAFGLRTLRRPA